MQIDLEKFVIGNVSSLGLFLRLSLCRLVVQFDGDFGPVDEVPLVENSSRDKLIKQAEPKAAGFTTGSINDNSSVSNNSKF